MAWFFLIWSVGRDWNSNWKCLKAFISSSLLIDLFFVRKPERYKNKLNINCAQLIVAAIYCYQFCLKMDLYDGPWITLAFYASKLDLNLIWNIFKAVFSGSKEILQKFLLNSCSKWPCNKLLNCGQILRDAPTKSHWSTHWSCFWPDIALCLFTSGLFDPSDWCWVLSGRKQQPYHCCWLPDFCHRLCKVTGQDREKKNWLVNTGKDNDMQN